MLAVTLMLWCAGTGCMLVSYAHGAAMSGISASKVGGAWGDVSASVGSHSCCKARHSSERHNHSLLSGRLAASESAPDSKEIRLAEVPDQSDAMSCCPLTSGSFVVTSRSQLNEDNASNADQRGSFSLTLTNSQLTPRFDPLRLSDQNQTYLRGCVFLI